MSKIISLMLLALLVFGTLAQAEASYDDFHWYDEVIFDLRDFREKMRQERQKLMRNMIESEDLSTEEINRRIDEFDEKADRAHWHITRLKQEQFEQWLLSQHPEEPEFAKKVEECEKGFKEDRFPLIRRMDQQGTGLSRLKNNVLTLIVAVPIVVGIDVVTYPFRAIGGFPTYECD